MTRHSLGRLLQFIGMSILPFGMARELLGKTGEGGLLLTMAGGAVVFYLGFLIQHRK